MLIFGEFNVFCEGDAGRILSKACQALKPGGLLLLEPHCFETIITLGRESPSWYSSKAGLFSDKPHICLTENFWDESCGIATRRYFIMDARSGVIHRYASSVQAYRKETLKDMLVAAGFDLVTIYPSLMGEEDPTQPDFFALTARKPVNPA